MVERFVLAVDASPYNLIEVASKLNLSIEDLLSRLLNGFEFMSDEMQILVEILGIKEPLDFFYK